MNLRFSLIQKISGVILTGIQRIFPQSQRLLSLIQKKQQKKVVLY